MESNLLLIMVLMCMASLVCCTCGPRSVHIKHLKLCVLGKRVGEVCTWDSECAIFDNNTVCHNKQCTCKVDYQLDSDMKCALKALSMADVVYLAKINQTLLPLFNSKLDDIDQDMESALQNETTARKECRNGFAWNESTDKCQQRLIAVKAENILFLFTVMFVFCVLFILILKKREQDFVSRRRTQTLLHNLMALHTYVSQQIELKEYGSGHTNPPPSYQDVFNSGHDIDDLPSYEEAIKLYSIDKVDV